MIKGEDLKMLTDFVCRNCGSEELAAIQEYATTVHYAAQAACLCDRSLHRIAATRCFHVTVLSQESGRLRKGGSWNILEQEDIAWLGATEDSFTLLCPSCADQTPLEQWNLSETGREIDRHGEFFSVRCLHCNGIITARTVLEQERTVGATIAS